jgi:uncharacterized membrane protein YjjP (DUF1212 family)
VSRSEITGPQVRPAALRPAPRVGKAWRERAQWVVRGVGPPTVAIGVPGGDDAVSQRHARAVIDLALRIGEAMLSTGSSTAEVVATVLRLIAAYEIRSAHVDITFTSITVSIHRGLHEDPMSVMRVVKVRSPDYTRLEEVQRLVDDIAASGEQDRDPDDIDRARRRLDRVLSAPHPYRRWVVTAGAALLAGAVVALFGSAPGMWVVAALSAALVDRVQRALSRAGIAAFFNQAVSAAIPTSVAAGLYWLESQGVDVPGVHSPSLVVIAGIIVLLAGLGVMGAAQDALDGYYVTAGARGLEVLAMTAGIAVGISCVLGLAQRLGVPMELSPYVSLGGTGAPLTSTIAAMLVAAGFAMSTYTGPRATLVAMGVAGVAWVVFELVTLLAFGVPATVAAAASVVGALGYAVHRRLRVPELAIATAGIVSMLPGLAVYRALYLMMEDSAALVGSALIELGSAVAIGLGLAAGLSIGGYLARRRFGLDAAALRATRRSRGHYR